MTEKRGPTVEVVGLSKTFGSQFALRNLSFILNKGESLTIFGPNGAGKTTLIKILSTISRPSSGRISIDGFSLQKEAQKIRRFIGVVAHQTFLYENLTAEENLRFYGKLYDVQNLTEKVKQVLHEVGLLHRKNDRVQNFSRGMQQRLAIARVMLHDPTLLLLDEPFTGLDQNASKNLASWLQGLRDDHRSILMVTHNLQRGLEIADRVAILKEGELVFDQPRASFDAAEFQQIYDEHVGDAELV